MIKFVLPTKTTTKKEKTLAESEKTNLKRTNFGVLIPKAKNTCDQKWD